MNSHFDVIYEVIEPFTREAFFTKDRYVAEHHYEKKGYTVYEHHMTKTKLSPFTGAKQDITLCWHDEDYNTETEEA